MRFAMLLDSGKVVPIPGSEAQARERVEAWREARRQALAEKAANADNPYHVSVVPRRVLGFVRLNLPRRDRNAQALGKAGGKARAAKLSRERRSEIARRAANARWKRDA